MDYENFAGFVQDRPDPAFYTDFLIQLGNRLHTEFGPPITFQIAISGEKRFQDFFDLPTLIQTGAVDVFQIMAYDYGTIQEGAPPMHVVANADIGYTKTLIERLLKQGMPPEKISIGIPLYGRIFELQPGQDVQRALDEGTLMSTNQYSVIIPDHELLSKKYIGRDWENPENGWRLIHDQAQPANYYYYNEDQNQIISAFPRESLNYSAVNRQRFLFQSHGSTGLTRLVPRPDRLVIAMQEIVQTTKI